MSAEIAVEPTTCPNCGREVYIKDGIVADANVDPRTKFEDLFEHECENE
jgi:hypothetical protein